MSRENQFSSGHSSVVVKNPRDRKRCMSNPAKKTWVFLFRPLYNSVFPFNFSIWIKLSQENQLSSGLSSVVKDDLMDRKSWMGNQAKITWVFLFRLIYNCVCSINLAIWIELRWENQLSSGFSSVVIDDLMDWKIWMGNQAKKTWVYLFRPLYHWVCSFN